MFLAEAAARAPEFTRVYADLKLSASRTPSATWRHWGASWTHAADTGALQAALQAQLGATWAPLGSVRLTLERFKPHSKRNLAPLSSISGALATLKIVLPCRRELNFHVFAVLPSKSAF